MLSYSDPILNKESRATTITDVLDEAGKRLDREEFANQPEIRAEMEESVGKILRPTRPIRAGIQTPGRSHRHSNQTLRREPSQNLVASAYYATMVFFRGAMAESEKIFRRILPLMQEEQRKGNIKAADMAYALNVLAYLRRTQGDSSEAESLFHESLALSWLLTNDEWRAINGTTRSTLASTLADQGRFEEALQTSREAVAEDTERGESDTPNFGFALTVYGGFLTEQGNYAEADARLHEAETIIRKSMSPGSLWLGDNLRNQAVSLYQQEKYSDALDRAIETLSIYRASFGTHYDHYPTALIVQGLSLTKIGKPKKASKSCARPSGCAPNCYPKNITGWH